MTAALSPRRLSLLDHAPPPALALVPSARGEVGALSPSTRALREQLRVALVTMPFQSARTPSIQLGLLSAIASSHGFPVETFHLNLDFAQRVELPLYEQLCQMRGRLMGDWLFSVAAFRSEAPDPGATFVRDFAADVADQLGEGGDESASATLRQRLKTLRIRDEIVPAYLNAMMAEIDWSRFQVVGFSSVFQQTVASMALARRIKEAHPEVRILFGGSNFDGEMGLELVRKVEWIDHAVVGEGDLAFPELLVALSEGKDPSALAGVVSRIEGAIRHGGKRKLFDRLDELPTPRYEEYFRRAEQTGLLTPSRRRTTLLPFESARGCWWGEKHHCTFCGLNNNGMKFRSKSPGRVADELSELARENRSFNFTAVDNIVEQDYLKTLFPRLVEDEKGYSFFYEVKANLTRAQIRDMRTAGIVAIQPGIESLSTRVLRLMRKGITASQNVNTLRWATYYGIHVAWNMLWGFPDETVEDYDSQARLIPLLTHLAPPGGGSQIRMERFSPLFTDEEAFPREFRRPEASYSYVYPEAIDLEKIAYFFDHKLERTLEPSAYDGVRRALELWRRSWNRAGGEGGREAGDAFRAPRPALAFSYSDDFLQISDTRRVSGRASFTFEGPHARLYKATVDRPVSAVRALELSGIAASPGKVERALGEFCERGVMMRDGDRFLALALPTVAGR